MAAKKIAKKAPPKKAAVKKSPPKKLAVKKAPPKKAPAKKAPPTLKKSPPKLAKTAPPAAPKRRGRPPKPESEKVKKEPVSNYRNLRKWTLPKFEAMLSPDMLASIRQRIRSTQKGALLASELFKYLQALEGEMIDWAEKAKPKGTPRGRKPKAAAASKAPPVLAKPKSLAHAKTVAAAAKTGTLLMKPAPKAPPPVHHSAIPRFVKNAEGKLVRVQP